MPKKQSKSSKSKTKKAKTEKRSAVYLVLAVIVGVLVVLAVFLGVTENREIVTEPELNSERLEEIRNEVNNRIMDRNGSTGTVLEVSPGENEGTEGDSEELVETSEVVSSRNKAALVEVEIDDDAVYGDLLAAEVGIIEFSDFGCQFCDISYADIFLELEKSYINSGELIYVQKDLPLSFNPTAQIQAEAAECAGEESENAYWELRNALFALSGEQEKEELLNLARPLVTDFDAFEICLNSGAQKVEIADDTQQALLLGINSTPSFVVGKLEDGAVEGEILRGAQNLDKFREVIEEYLTE